MTKGYAPAIREHLKGLPVSETFSAAQVAKALGYGNANVQHAFGDFKKRGEIVRVKLGQYRYKGIKHLRDGAARIKPRLLRAMHVKTSFTIREVAMLADSKVDYASKVVRKLREAGEIERTGERKGLRGQPEGIYRVCDRDAFYLNHLALRNPKARRSSEPDKKEAES